MKQNSGFIFIEVLAVFLGITVLLAALLKVCGSSVLLLQKSNELQAAWQYLQSEENNAGSDLQRIELTENIGALQIREIRVMQGEKIISNMVCAE